MMNCSISKIADTSEFSKSRREDCDPLIKPKKRRRGKKRKLKTDSGIGEDDENKGNINISKAKPNAENSHKEVEVNHTNLKHTKRVLIRPLHVPKAPENSTQFIIDDHKGCGLYFSFETPNPYYKGEYSVPKFEIGSFEADAAFQDIDYEYESPQDLDATAFYAQDFELAYNRARYEQLLLLPTTELIDVHESMEERLRDTEDDLVKCDPSQVLEQLQQELLVLQEENALLKQCNLDYIKMLKEESNESASDEPLQNEEFFGHEIV